MKKPKYSYDPRCYDLGALFLSYVDGSAEDDRQELAQAIQDVIEEHCRDVARRTEAYMSRAE